MSFLPGQASIGIKLRVAMGHERIGDGHVGSFRANPEHACLPQSASYLHGAAWHITFSQTNSSFFVNLLRVLLPQSRPSCFIPFFTHTHTNCAAVLPAASVPEKLKESFIGVSASWHS